MYSNCKNISTALGIVPVGVAEVGTVAGFAILLPSDVSSASVELWAFDTAGGKKPHLITRKHKSQMRPYSEASLQYSVQEEQRTVLFIPATLSNNAVMYSWQRPDFENVSGLAGGERPADAWRVCHSNSPVSGPVRHSYKEVALAKTSGLQQSWIVVRATAGQWGRCLFTHSAPSN